MARWARAPVRSVINAGSSDLGSVESATTIWLPRLPVAGAAFAGAAVAAGVVVAGVVVAGVGAATPGVGGAGVGGALVAGTALVGAHAQAASVRPPTI